MPSLWESLAESDVKAGLQRVRNESELRRQTKVAELRAHIHGGDRPISSIRPFDGELPEEYAERLAAFSHFGITSMIAQELGNGVYGRDVKREIRGFDDANAQLQEILKATHFSANQTVLGMDQSGVGNAFVAIQFSPELNQIALPIVAMENVFVERVPENPFEMMSLVEQRSDPNKPEKIANWIWTKRRYRVVDEDGANIPWVGADGQEHVGWVDNPYGVIPYAHWRGRPWAGEFWGQSLLEDTVQLNKLINNRLSDLSVIIAHQAFSQGWVRNAGAGAQKNPLQVGPRRFIPLDEGGEMGYAQPGAPIKESFDTIESMMDWCARLAMIPTSVVRGGSAASGYALEVEFRSMRNVVRMLTKQAMGAEDRLIRCICAVANAHPQVYRGFPAFEKADVNVEFDENFLPRDTQQEKDSDGLDVEAGRMLLEDYVAKWRVPPGSDDAKIAAYTQKLNAQRATKAAQMNPFGSPSDNLPPDQRPGLLQ